MIKLTSKNLVAIVLAFALLAASPLRAQDIAPDALAKKVTDEVVAVLRADKDIQAGNSKKVLDLVESKILPHFNFARMTRLAVGAPWRQTTPAQQQTLTTEFRTLLVHTYTSAFMQYRDQVIEYRPFKMAPGDKEVVVRSLIKQKTGADPIDINYSMEKVDGAWKVYDVVIAGVSLVQNYRSSFASEIQKSGVDGLIATLAAKNKSLAQQQAGKK
ncbi:MAG: ABC transporter substrate-binding protein [Betaproteobacteria bacterium]